MAFKRRNTPARGKQRPRKAVEPSACRFCRDKVRYVDYKNVEVLGKLLTQRAKIFSRKRSGNCAGCQRKVRQAIKRARFMALLPYVN